MQDRTWPLPGVLLSTLLVLAMAMPLLAAEEIPVPPLAPVERGAYRARDMRTGEELSRAEWILHRETEAGRLVVDLHEKGTQERPGARVWSSRMRLDLRGPHPVLTSTKESRDAAGRPVQVEQREFDYGLSSGQLVRTEPLTGVKASRPVRLTAHAITTELLPAILRLLPETKDRRMRFDLVTANGQTIGMQVRVIGRESVNVPAGTFDCFKLELEPTGLAGVLAALKLVKLYMWHTVAAPHFWVKYQGPDGVSTSREIIRELLRFETRTASAAMTEGVAPGERGHVRSTSIRPSVAPHGTRAPAPSALGYLVVLAAIVFEVGVEATRLLTD